MNSPLTDVVLFHIGPAPITSGVVTTWAIMAALTSAGFAVSRRLQLAPSKLQATAELIVEALDGHIRDTMRVEPEHYRAFIGALFLFIFVANWSSLAPGAVPPTAHLETDAALPLIVFVAVIVFGVRARDVGGWLSTFASPNPIMIPLNSIERLTRTFSPFVRLFGNVMSGVFLIGVVLSLFGLLVPIPLMALDLLTRRGTGLAASAARPRRGRCEPPRTRCGSPMRRSWNSRCLRGSAACRILATGCGWRAARAFARSSINLSTRRRGSLTRWR